MSNFLKGAEIFLGVYKVHSWSESIFATVTSDSVSIDINSYTYIVMEMTSRGDANIGATVRVNLKFNLRTKLTTNN